jgi:CheY-like chemotaxis protein
MPKLKVLVADDLEAVRKSLARLLRSYSVDIDFAVNSNDAIMKACNNDYVLIIMDNDMNDGIYAIEEIRKLRPNVPIIMFSGDAFFDVAAEAMNKGANKFISKNDVAVLAAAIKEYLR